MSGEPPPKRHKKHKRDRDRDRYDEKFGGGTPTYSSGGPSAGNARLKLILKVGGSSTPEHSDSPGPAHVLSVPYDEDSRASSLSYSHVKKSKKKEKKKKKDKKHKHHHKKKRREKTDLLLQEAVMGSSPLNMPQTVSPITVIGKSFIENMDTGDRAGSPSPLAVSREPRPGILKPQRVVDKVPLQKLLQHLARALEKKDPQQFFAWPVTDKIAPGYSSIITQPMDFSSMKAKVDATEYSTYMEFVDDFKRMCSNAMTYNHAETVYYKAAKKLLQSGLKILDPSKIRALDPLIPSIRMLTDEQFPFPIFQDLVSQEMGSDLMSQTDEEEIPEPFCKDPTQNIHYMAPHPNDPPDPCGAFTEDLVMEEVLIQARIAAREAAHRLTSKKPNSKLGFLRQKEDGTTSLAILTSGAGVTPGTKEQPVSLGALTGKITHGTSHLIGSREEKKTHRGPKPLSYGPFSSYAPSHDSTFAQLTKDESELVEATYGDDTASQYAESIFEFAKGCDYAMRMVDEILNTLTKGEHSRTIELIEERKKLQEEEAQAKREQEEYVEKLEQEWGLIEMGFPPTISEVSNETLSAEQQDSSSVTNGDGEENVDFEALKSLDDLGIDTGFLDDLKDKFHNTVNRRLSETAELLGNLERVQHDRLSLPIQANPPYVLPPTDEENQISDKIQEKLIDLAKMAHPGDLVSTAAIHKALGIDLKAFRYTPPSTTVTSTTTTTARTPPVSTSATTMDSNSGTGESTTSGTGSAAETSLPPAPPSEPQNPENANVGAPVPMETGEEGWSAVTTTPAISTTTESSSTESVVA